MASGGDVMVMVFLVPRCCYVMSGCSSPDGCSMVPCSGVVDLVGNMVVILDKGANGCR